MSKYDLVEYDIRTRTVERKRNGYWIDDPLPTEYSVKGSELWKTMKQLRDENGLRTRSVLRRIESGRPINVQPMALMVIGGEHDGQWLMNAGIQKITGGSRDFVKRHAEGHTFPFRKPDPKMVRQGVEAMRRSKGSAMEVDAAARAFAILPRIAA